MLIDFSFSASPEFWGLCATKTNKIAKKTGDFIDFVEISHIL